MKIETVKIKDINEKELLYLRIENSKGQKVNINVGQKTIDKVRELIEEENKDREQLTEKTKTK